MTENDIKILMEKYLNGTITRREEMLLEEFDSALLSKNKKKVFKDARHRKFTRQKLLRSINKRDKQTRGLRRARWGKIAAAAALILSMGHFMYKAWNNKPREQPVTQLVKTTEWGQKLSLTLTDGTEVRLNSGSTIKFPERFTGQSREVELTGEAFFNVAKNPDKPFIIKSNEVHTTVLGTSFNINTYPDNPEITVTVATGKVKVASQDREVLLGPNEQGVFDRKSNRISKGKIDITNFIQWKDGIIHFEDTSLLKVVQVLECWYGVTFGFENEAIKNCHLTATYDNEILSVVLESIVYAKKGLHYQYLDDNKILIKGKCSD
ncbi:FecR family protein [Sinomicrobium sp. M5D2P17]